MKKIYTFFLVLFIQCMVFSQAFQWQWQNSKPIGNDLNDIVSLTATRVLTFGTAGTVGVSTDGGNSWQLIFPDSARNDIWNSYFLNATTGFICGGNGLIMKTTDGGNTWVYKNSGSTSILYDIEFHTADTGIAVGASGTVLRTFNGGDTWTASLAGSSTNYKVCYVNSSTIYIGSATSTSRLMKSTDFGATFVNATPAAVTTTVYGMCVVSPTTYYLVDALDGIIATTDGGTTWALQQASTNAIYDIKFTNSANGIACDAKGNLLYTSNGGTNWTTITMVTHKTIRAMGLSSGYIYLAGASGTLYKGATYSGPWIQLFTTATQDYLRKIQFKDNFRGWACGGSSTAGDSIGNIVQTTDGGLNWAQLPYNFKVQLYSFSMPTNTTWYAGGSGNRFFKTTDGGATFTILTTPLSGATFWATAFASDLVGYTGASSGKLLKTTDGGTTWTDLSTAAGFGTNTIYDIALIDANTFYAAGLGARIVKTTDGGNTFTQLSPGIPGSFFAVKFKNATTGIVCGSSLGASKTTDGGATWTPMTVSTTLVSTTSLWAVGFADSGYTWISTINGDVLYSVDGGTTWALSKKPTSQVIDGIAIYGNNMWLAGNGGVIVKGYASPYLPVELTSFTGKVVDNTIQLSWKTSSEINNNGFEIQREASQGNFVKIGFVKGNGTTTLAKNYSYTDNQPANGKNNYRLKQIDLDGTYKYSNITEVNFGIPNKFDLGQNYPNPFNPVTVIKYSIPVKSNVELKVFNVLGKEVALVVNEIQEPGIHKVEFGSSQLASGVYFYQLKAGSYTSVKKMVLLK